jgi:hypothetical protein
LFQEARHARVAQVQLLQPFLSPAGAAALPGDPSRRPLEP